jgi:hypothetical protein
MNTQRILKVLALAMQANPNLPIPLTLDNIDLLDITATPKGIRNTSATMAAIDTGEVVRYVGSSGVVYDRIDVATYWTQRPVIELASAVTVGDLVTVLNEQHGLDVYLSEIKNADDVLPDEGNITIAIDDAVSPLYIGEVVVTFTKDAGLNYQDGLSYELAVSTNNRKPILGYLDTNTPIQVSVNGGVWVPAVITKIETGLYSITPPSDLSPGIVPIRLRGDKIFLIDWDGNYVPITTLVEYKSLTEATGFFSGITSLTTIASDAFKRRPELTSADYLFDGCKQLAVLPDNLLSYCPLLTTAKACFRKTAVVNIPETLLESCSRLVSVESMFEQCTKLAKIPGNLFRTNTALTTVARCFVGTTVTNEEIPEGLLDTQLNLKDASYLFGGCTWLTFIPDDFFINNTQLTNLTGAFTHCVNLTLVQSDLFVGLTKLNRIDRIFEGCSKIAAIPSTLLNGLINLEYAEYAFASTGILATPSTMFSGPRRLLSIDYIFANCTKLNNIPYNLIYSLPRLESLNGVWMNCMSIIGVQTNTFDKNLNVLSIDYLFAGTGLPTIPLGIFDKMVKIKSAVGLAANSKIYSVMATLFDKLPALEDVSLMFYKATLLVTVPPALFSLNTKITNMMGTFAYVPMTNNVTSMLAASVKASVKTVTGIYQGATVVQGTFSALKAALPLVDWTDPEQCAGCVAGCTLLTDYATIGTVYKTPVTFSV